MMKYLSGKHLPSNIVYRSDKKYIFHMFFLIGLRVIENCIIHFINEGHHIVTSKYNTFFKIYYNRLFAVTSHVIK